MRLSLPRSKWKWTGGFLLLTTVVFAASQTAFQLFDAGTEDNINYETYGMFTNPGTRQYRYLIKDRVGLAKAAGEGIYPNVESLLKDPAYKAAQKEGRLEGPVWDFVNNDDVQMNFFKWASSREEPGVKQFYIATMLERAGLIKHAIKAYYACAVHFPKATGQTFWKTPWYIGPTSLDKVHFLLRQHPEYKLQLSDARIRVKYRFDDNVHNDVVEAAPGKIERLRTVRSKVTPKTLSKLTVEEERGRGKVRLRRYTNGHWQMIVDDKPMILKSIAYTPTPVGKSPDDGSWVQYRDWMTADDDKNEKIDGPYDSFVDKNNNNEQDKNEPVIGDFQLMKDMGVNNIRLYHHGFNKTLFTEMYEKYGITITMGDFFGAYTIGSGADWNAGTDYSDPKQQESMLASVRQMVEQYKNEPYIIMWVLGNENNYGNANNCRKNPVAYYQFVNRAAQMIKSMDPNHPVAICNGDLLYLDLVAKYCPDVDVYGANAYRGEQGPGESFWQDVADEWGKPVFISEFGCPAYHHTKSREEAERLQADYLKHNWEDIERNVGGNPGVGNSLGGVLFEFLDEWWKAGPPPQYDAKIQDIVGQFGGPFPDGWSYEEWFGVVSQGTGKNSPIVRQLRKAYTVFKDELWGAKPWSRRNLPE